MQPTQFGAFSMEAEIGRGAMGTVYRARFTKTNQVLAVKLLPEQISPTQAARFEREIAILKQLKHPNIVRIFGSGTAGGRRYYAMEYIGGGSLEGRLRERGRLFWADVVRLGIQMAEGLAYAHEEGVVHRDLKPGNVLLTTDDRVKLSDFGIAKALFAADITEAGKTVGTYAYMAPEQIRGKPPVGPRTDLYALGAVLFELLTGHVPFPTGDVQQIFFHHLTTPPPRPAGEVLDVPVWLDVLVHRLLAKDPDERPRDALAVAQALREVQQKVAEGASVLAHVASEGPTTFSRDDLQATTEHVAAETLPGIDVPGAPVRRPLAAATAHDVRSLVRRPRKRKKKTAAQGPIYERAWFLGAALAALVAFCAWLMWPASEDELFEEASALMPDSNPIDWSEPPPELHELRELLDELHERFPDGEHIDEVREMQAGIDMFYAQRRARLNARLGREPRSEAERLYMQALRFELFGDRWTAQNRYDALVLLLEDETDAESQVYVNLARERRARLGDLAGEPTERARFVREALARADEHWNEGRWADARAIWESVVELYRDQQEMEPLVAEANRRLRPPPEEFEAPEGASDPE